MEFTSQICTTEEQSKRLLALGLKKETADCYYYARQRWNGNDYENTGELILVPVFNHNDNSHYEYLNEIFYDEIGENNTPYVIPAWSLHRLLCFLPTEYITDIDFQQIMQDFVFRPQDMYDEVISCIETLIKEGYFYEEYLEE